MPNLPEPLRDVKIFPCGLDKRPLVDNGWKEATNDPAKISAWERQFPGCNWAVATGLSNLFVIDVDPNGLAEWERMRAADSGLRDAINAAFTVRTPRGGYHHYFIGEGPTTASRIADGIDTRAGFVDETGVVRSGGYALLPGSRTADGIYQILGGNLGRLGPAVAGIVPERKKGTVHGLERDPAKDQPRNVQWATDLLNNYVKEGRVSVEGRGGNNTAYQVVASVLDKGISPALTFELIDQIWNPHCAPAWDDWELETLIENAVKYGEDTGKGSKGFTDNATAFAKFAGMEFPEEKPEIASRRDRVQWIDDYAASVGDPEWLLPGILPAHGTGMLYGASGSYKSFLALDMASCIAHGHAGQWRAPPVVNDVLYFAGEAPVGTSKQRRPAWLEWQKPEKTGRLAVYPRVPPMTDETAWSGVKLDIEEMQMRPRLIVIDTLSRMLSGFDENSTKDATLAMNFVEDLARYYECFVLVVHHTGKDESKGARGSSVFLGNSDTMLATKKRGEGTELRVKKHKDADAPDEPMLFKKKEVLKSIVLERTDILDEPAGKGTSKVSWSDRDAIAKIITANGGRISQSILIATIAGDHGIDAAKVQKELRTRQDIQWMRNGHDWALPVTEPEYDL